MHFQSLLVLHGLQKKSKGIMPRPGEQGAVHQELLGAPRAVLNPSLGTALPTNPQLHINLSSHLLRTTPPHCPQGRMQAEQPPCHHHGNLHPQIPRGRKARHNKPQHCCSLPQLPPQPYIIHFSDISTANLAKQKCFFFNTSKNWELSGGKLIINSPLLFAVAIYSQE